MNRIFRLVFNRTLGLVQVASELACRHRLGAGGAMRLLPPRALLAVALALAGGSAWAQVAPGQLPTGEIVVGGSASINRDSAANLLQITQNGRTIIDWTSFDIGTQAHVDFVQSAGSIALNRVTGGGLSQILGKLEADAGIFLINPSGVLFGAGAQVNVGSLMVSTLSPQAGFDGGFLSGGNQLNLAQSGDPGLIRNEGTIVATNGGSISLIGGTVQNWDRGKITADGGAVQLVGAKEGTFTTGSTHEVLITAGTAPVNGMYMLVDNTGTLQSNGGHVTLAAQGISGGADTTVNTTGVIVATDFGGTPGRITLAGGSYQVNVGGQVTASGALAASTTIGTLILSGDIGAGTFEGRARTITQEAGNEDAPSRLQSGGTTLTASSGDITLANTGNSLGGITAFQGRNVSLRSDGGIGIRGVSRATGNLTLDADGAITQTGALSVAGTTTLNARESEILLANAGNDFVGAVGVRGGGITLRDTNDLTVSAINNAPDSTLSLTAGGTLTLPAGAIDTGSANLVLSAGRSLSTPGALRGGIVHLHGGDGLTLAHAVEGTETLRLSSGGAIERSGTARIQGGRLELDAASADLGGANAIGELGDIDVDGALTLRNAQGIAQAAGTSLRVGGAAGFDGGNNAIVLTNAGNDFQGTVDLTTGGSASIVDAGALTLGTVTVTGDLLAQAGTTLDLGQGGIAGTLVAQAGGDIVQSGALALGPATLEAGGAITLDHAGNAFGGPLDLTATGNVRIASTTGLDFSQLEVGSLQATSGAGVAFGGGQVAGDLDITAAGAVGQSGALLVIGATTIETSGHVLLDDQSNQFDGALSLTGDAVEIGGQQLRLVHVDAASLVATADGIELSGTFETIGGQRYAGAVRLVGATVVDAGGDASFVQTVDGAQLLTIDAGGAVAMSGAVGATTALAGLTIDAAGFTAGGTLRTTGDTAVSIAAGDIVQQGAFRVGGNARFATGNGSITLANAGNAFTGPVSLTGHNVQIRDSAALRFGALDVASLWAIAPQLLLPGSLATTGLQYYDGSVTLDRDTQLTSTNGTVILGGTVDGAHALVVDAGLVAFDGAVGGGTALSSLDTRGAALTRIGADITTSGDIAFGNTQVGAAQATVRSSAGAVTVAGSLDATTSGQGALTLDAHDAVTLSGNAGATGALADLTLDGGSVSTRGIRVANALQIASGGDIVQAGVYDVGGNAHFVAAGDITLDNDANLFAGTVSLAGNDAVVHAASPLALDTVDVDRLGARSTGTLSLSDARIAGDATLLGSGLSLADFDIGGDLGATAGSGGIALADGRVRGDLAADSGGDITQTAALRVEGAARFDAGTARIALDHADNDFEATVDLGGGAVSVNDRNDLRLGTVDADSLDATSHGALDLGTTTLAGGLTAHSNGGAITQGGDLVVAGASVVDARGGGIAGDITLTRAGNVLGGPVTLAGRDVAIAANALSLAGVEARNLLATAGTIALRGDVTTGEDQDYAGAVRLDDDATLAAGGDVTFASTVDGAHELEVRSGGHAGFGGAVALGALDVEAGSATFGATVTTSGDLTVDVQSGGIVQSGAFTVGGIGDFDANGGAITLTHAGNDFAGRVHLRGDVVAIQDANALALGSVSAGALNADSHGMLDLGTATVARALEARSNGGDIVQSGALAVGGTSLLDASGGDVVLDLPGNDFGGAVTVSGATVTLRDDDALTLASVTVGEDLTVTSHGALDLGAGTVGGRLAATSNDGAIVQSGALEIAGASTIDAGTGAVTLDHMQNDFGGRVDITGGAVAIADRDRLVLGAVDADSLQATAAAIALQDDISTRGDQDYAGAVAVESDVSLAASAGGIGFGGTVSGPHRLAVDAAGHAAFDAAVALGALDLEAGSATFASTVDIADRLDVAVQSGGIHQSGAFTVGGDTLLDANGGAITLDHVDNDFAGTVQLDGGVVRIHDANALTLGTVNAQALEVTNDGTLVFGRTDVEDMLVADSGIGSIEQTDALTVRGTASFTSGAGIELTHADNDFEGAVSLDGTKVAIRDANALTLDTVTAQALEVTSNGDLVFGRTDVEETLVADSGSGGIEQSDALTVRGTASFASGAVIDLTHADNDFEGVVSLDGTTVAIGDANALTLGTVTAQTLEVTSDGDLTFGRTDVEETLVADSGIGSIEQTDALTVRGTASFASGAGIELTHADNDFAGAVSLDGTTVAIRDTNALALGTVTARTLDVNSDGDLTFGRTDVEEALVADSGTGSIEQTDALTVRGTVSFTSGAVIDLTHADNDFEGAVSLAGTAVAIRDTNALALGTVTARTLDVNSDGDLTFGRTDVEETLIVDSGSGGIEQTDALTVRGAASFASGSGIDLTHADNDFEGAVSLDGTTVAIRDANALTLDTVTARTLDVTSDGDLAFGRTDVEDMLVADSGTGSIEQTDALTVRGAASFTSDSGIALTHADNDFAGAVSLDGTAVAIRDANALTLDTVTAQTLEVTSNGNLVFGRTDVEETLVADSGIGGIEQTDALTVRGAASFASGSGIELTHADNDFAGAVSLDGTTVAIRDTNALALGTVTARTLVVTTDGALVFGRTDVEETLVADSGTGSIEQTDALTVRGTASFTSGAGIELTHADNDFEGAVSLDGTKVAIRDVNALTLDTVTAQTLDVTSNGNLAFGRTDVEDMLVADSGTGSIEQSDALTVRGAASFTSGAAIDLTHADNDFEGTVSLDGTTVAIRDVNALTLDTVTARTLDVTSNGDLAFGRTDVEETLVADSGIGGIEQTDALTARGAASFTSGAAIDLTHADNDFEGAVSLDGTTVAIRDMNALALGTVTARTLDVNSNGGLTFGRTDVEETLVADSGIGGIEQTDALTVRGAASFASGSGIELTHADNDFAGAVSLAGTTVAIRDANALTLGTVTVQTLDVTSNGDLAFGRTDVEDTLVADSGIGGIEQTDALTARGAASFTSGAAIDLTHAGNDFAGAVALAGTAVAIRDINALTLDTVTAQTLAVTSNGALVFGRSDVEDTLVADSGIGGIEQTDALTVRGAASFTSGSGIALTHVDNDFGGAVSLAGTAVAIRDTNALALGTVTARTLEVTNDGALVFGRTDVEDTLVADSGIGGIEQTDALTVRGAASFTSGSGIELTHADNDFGGAVWLAGTTVAIRDANALTLGAVTAQTLEVTSNGDLVFGRTDVEDTLVADSGSGGIEQTDALTVRGAASFASGSGIALTHADNDFEGAVSLAGTTVAIRDTNALALGTVTARTLDVNSDGDLTFGRTDVEETLVADSGSGGIEQTDALTVRGTASFTSGAAIDLSRDDNDFGGAVSLDGTTVAIRDANALTLDTVTAQTLDVTSNGDLTFGRTDVEEMLVASSGTGSIGQSDALTVGGAASFTSGAGIDLSRDDNDFGGAVSLAGTTVAIRDANALTLGTVTARTLAATSNGNLAFGRTDVEETLVADSGIGSIEQTDALTVRGAASFTSGSGIELTHADNDFGGAVSLTGTTVAIRDANALTLDAVTAQTLEVTTDGALVFGRTNIEDTLVADSGSGGIEQTDALTVRGAASFASGSGIELTHVDNDFGGAVSLAGTAVAIRDANALTLGTVTAQTLEVTSDGDLTFGRTDVEDTLVTDSGIGGIEQTDALTVRGAASFTSGSGIELTHAGNDFEGAVSLAGTAIAIQDANALTLGTVDAQALDVRSHGDLDLGTATVAGTLVANSHGGAIGQSGALLVGGTSTLAAGTGAIVLDNASNDFTGRVDIAGGAVRIADANTLALGRVDAASLRAIAGTIVLHADIDTDGDQDYDGAVALAADVDLAARDGGIAFASTVSGAHALDVRASGHAGFGGDVALAGLAIDAGSFRADGTLAIDDGAGGGDLSIAVETGGIAQSGAFRVGGAATFDANGGAIALTDAGNDFAGVVDLAGGDVAIRDANALTIGALDVGTLLVASQGALGLGAGTIAGSLVADSNGGAITQSGALAVGGDAGIDAGAGAIVLDHAGNDFAGRVHLTGDAVSIADANALALGTVRAGALTVDSHGALALGDVAVERALVARSHGGPITQADALHVGAATRLDAGSGDIVLDHAGNDFVGAVDASGGAISLRDANDLVVDRLGAGSDRDVRLVAGRALTLPAHALDTGRGSLTLAAHGGALTTRGALGGGDVALHGASGIAIGHDIDAAGTLALESGGDIAQDGGRIAAGTLTGRASGAVRLDGANRIDTLGAFSANGVRLSNAQSLAIEGTVSAGDSLRLAVDGDLAIDGRVTAGDLRLETTGGIAQGAGGPLVAGTLSGRAGGVVLLGDAGNVVDNRVERIGDFTARAGFSLTNGQSLTLASLNGSRFTIDAGTADFYLAVIGDLRQDGTDWLYNGHGTWAATGGIGLPASPIYVTATGQQRVAAIGQPPAYFYAVRPDGSLLPIVGEASVNVPTSVWAGRAQSSSNRQVAYVDVGADATNYRPYGVVEPGIRLPADQAPECDPDFPSDECAEAAQ
ncbi:filamentous hemagglutinin N-terminal domain-containing protein [Luteimonas sp. XNQY3]|nr:filamentous hemagglutinin N-terminal domain-containing protein [Luteimonas sp. XNQY3]MCD9007360.1 filamentous hemagglutinin N-terminal domain-containing protein [Luteimonas sp. XNQY3]